MIFGWAIRFVLMVPFIVTISLNASMIVVNKFKWEFSTVKVCWLAKGRLPEPKLKNFRDVVRQSVVDNFMKEEVGIEFVGWENCQPGNDSQVQITLEAGLGRKFFVGGSVDKVGRFDLSTTGGNIEMSSLRFQYFLGRTILFTSEKENQIISNLAVHEFGHIAGLDHEHEPVPGRERPVDPDKFIRVSVKDPYSVMDYANMPDFNSNDGLIFNSSIQINLSELDKHGLRCLYLYSADLVKTLCQPNYSMK